MTSGQGKKKLSMTSTILIKDKNLAIIYKKNQAKKRLVVLPNYQESTQLAGLVLIAV